MQLTSNTKINFSYPLSPATRVTTQWLKQPIFFLFFCNDILLNIDTISYQGVLLSTVIVEPPHVVALTHSTI